VVTVASGRAENAGRVRLLANPGGGRGRVGRRLAELERLAAGHGVPLETSTGVEDLVARARRAAADGIERLIVAGGDGTVHWALQGLAGSRTALAVVPLGSGNDIAAVLGFERTASGAFRQALEAPIREADLGRHGDRWFAGVAGAGFDGEVNRYANRRFRRLSGPPIYVLATLRVLATFVPPHLRLRTDREELETRAYFACFANCHRYGGGMRIAPEASPFDGQLDLVVVRGAPKRVLLALFPRVFSGRHCTHRAVWTAKATWADLSFDREFQAFGDGEPLSAGASRGHRFELVPRAVRVVNPAADGGGR
jgi:diacylglycerol kinase (ATP)